MFRKFLLGLFLSTQLLAPSYADTGPAEWLKYCMIFSCIPGGGEGSVTEVTGTANEINVANGTTTPTISIANNVILPGDGSATLPEGTDEERNTPDNGIRYNTTGSYYELYYPEGDGWTEIPLTGGIDSVSGTVNQITASTDEGAVTLSITTNPTIPGNTTIAGGLEVQGESVIEGDFFVTNSDDDAILEVIVNTGEVSTGFVEIDDGTGNGAFGGTGALTLPAGDTAQQTTPSNGIRYNSETFNYELYFPESPAWTPISFNEGSVTSVSGTANEITVVDGTTTPTISITTNPVLPGNVSVTGTFGVTGSSSFFGADFNVYNVTPASIFGVTKSTGVVNTFKNILDDNTGKLGINITPLYSVDVGTTVDSASHNIAAVRLAESTTTPVTPLNTNDLLLYNNTGTFSLLNTSGTVPFMVTSAGNLHTLGTLQSESIHDTGTVIQLNNPVQNAYVPQITTAVDYAVVAATDGNARISNSSSGTITITLPDAATTPVGFQGTLTNTNNGTINVDVQDNDVILSAGDLIAFSGAGIVGYELLSYVETVGTWQLDFAAAPVGGVTGPVSAYDGGIATYNGASGQVIESTNVPLANGIVGYSNAGTINNFHIQGNGISNTIPQLNNQIIYNSSVQTTNPGTFDVQDHANTFFITGATTLPPFGSGQLFPGWQVTVFGDGSNAVITTGTLDVIQFQNHDGNAFASPTVTLSNNSWATFMYTGIRAGRGSWVAMGFIN